MLLLSHVQVQSQDGLGCLQQQNHQNKVEAAEKSDSIAISFCIQHYLFCSWSLASVTSSPGVVAYTALKLRLYSFQLQNNSVLHTSAASETITSYMHGSFLQLTY